MYLEEIKALAQQLWDLEPLPHKECSEDEVASVEQFIGHRLPTAYREFLLWIGHSGGLFCADRIVSMSIFL